MWVFNGIQVRSVNRVEDFRAVGVFTNVGQLNESTSVILASVQTENYRIVCRVEQGNIIEGLTFQQSDPAYLRVFGKLHFVFFPF